MNLERIKNAVNTELHDRENLRLGLILAVVASSLFGINSLVNNNNLGSCVTLATAALSAFAAAKI